MRTLLCASISAAALTGAAFAANPVSVGPSGDFATIQAAISSFCVGGANAGETPPFIINIDPAGSPYNERITLNDAYTGLGDIAGDIVIQSDTPGTYAVLALERDAGEAAGANSSCLQIYQNEHDVTLRDLIIHPALPVASVTEDARRYIIKIDENSANATLNTITLENLIVCEVAPDGLPLITTRAEAYDPPRDVSASARDANFSNTIQYWGDNGESNAVVLNNVVLFGPPPGGTQIGNHFRGNMVGSNGESITITNSVFAYGPTAGALVRIGTTSTYTGSVSITGGDQTAGPDDANVFINTSSGHALTFEGTLAGGASGNIPVTVENAIFVFDSEVGTPGNQRAISAGTGIWDLTVNDLLIDVPGAAFVAFANNAAQWSNITAVSDQAFFGLGGTGSLQIRDSIFTGEDTVANDGKFGGTAPTGGVDIDYVAFGTEVTNKVGAAAVGTFTLGANILDEDPEYRSRNFTNASYRDVQNPAFGGAATAAADLVGGANYDPAATYVWDVNGAADFTAPASWNPARNTPADNDRLIFDGAVTAGPVEANSLPDGTQIIGKLILQNGIEVTLKADNTTNTAGVQHLEPSEDSEDALWISADSTLIFNKTAGQAGRVGIRTGVDAVGTVHGTVRFTSEDAVNGVTHRLIGGSTTGRDGIIFETGSKFEFAARGTGWGNPFSNVGRVRFNDGSAYYQGGTESGPSEGTGSNPFNNAEPNARMFCEPDSLFYNWTSVYSWAGRTYGNLHSDNRGATHSVGTGDTSFIQGDWVIKDGATGIIQWAAGGVASDPNLVISGDFIVEANGRYRDLVNVLPARNLEVAGDVSLLGTDVGFAADNVRNLVLNGTTPQSLGIEPTNVLGGLNTLYGLTINNAAGVTLTTNIEVRNFVDLVDGELHAPGGRLILQSGATVSGNGIITGILRRQLDAAVPGVYTLPIGTTPVSVEITSAGSGDGHIEITTDGNPGANLPGGTTGIARTWTLAPDSISGFTATLVFTYDDAELNGASESNLQAARWTGSDWELYPGSVVDTGANTVTVAGVTTLSDWTLLDDGSTVSDWNTLND